MSSPHDTQNPNNLPDPASKTGTPNGPSGTPRSRGFELKKRRRWPLIAGLVAVVVIAGGAITGAALANRSTGGTHFGSELKVSYTSSDAAQQAVVEFIADNVADKYGITVVPTGIGDPNQLSQSVNDGEIAATVYAHRPWIEQTNAAKGWQITPTEPIFQWAYSVYSSKYASLDALPDGATVAILDDPANTAQALILLDKAGVIGLDPSVDPAKSTLKDVAENPKHLNLKQIAFGTAARSLNDLDAIVSYNFEFNAASTPAKYRIYAPPAPPVFAAQLSVGTAYLSDPNIQKLIEAFKDPALTEFLATTDDPRVKDQLAPVSAS